MGTTTFPSIKHLRERLGYTPAGVARLSRVSKDRLLAIEGGTQPTFFEIEELARLFGVDADSMAEEPITVHAHEVPSTLASLEEFREIGDELRARIVGVASAARDLHALRSRLGYPVMTLAAIRRKASGLHDPKGSRPSEQGRNLAHLFREKLRLDRSEPVYSVRDLFTGFYPEAMLLYAALGRTGPAGLTFADDLRGAVVVLNLDGKNEQPLVRRFSLAHELCHLLLDVDGKTPLAQLSGYLTDSGLSREQRANAFALRLLCPESALRRVRAEDGAAAAVQKLSKFGLPYAAIRLYLQHSRNIELPALAPHDMPPVERRWFEAEEPAGIRDFPLGDTPPERRTRVAEAASQAYCRGLIPRDRFAALLGVTPLHEVERVLDFFGLPEPADADAA